MNLEEFKSPPEDFLEVFNLKENHQMTIIMLSTLK